MSREISLLIVDDCDIIREKLQQMVTEVKEIKNIFLAYDFDSAMHEVKTNQPSVVLLDINLPGRNGIEILKEIKTMNKKTKVIMVSNTATEYHQKICGFLGADFFIDKHNDFESIPSLIETLYTKKYN